jgi:hypothetical protein
MMHDFPILFMDIDGCLNNHAKMPNGYCGIDRGKVDLLNNVLADTSARIVLSSSWRYNVLTGKMTLAGLNDMMATHGLRWMSIVGVLPPEGIIADRGVLCYCWLEENVGRCFGQSTDMNKIVTAPGKRELRFCAVDDLDLGYSKANIPFVQTDGTVGLTIDDCRRMTQILLEKP